MGGGGNGRETSFSGFLYKHPASRTFFLCPIINLLAQAPILLLHPPLLTHPCAPSHTLSLDPTCAPPPSPLTDADPWCQCGGLHLLPRQHRGRVCARVAPCRCRHLPGV